MPPSNLIATYTTTPMTPDMTYSMGAQNYKERLTSNVYVGVRERKKVAKTDYRNNVMEKFKLATQDLQFEGDQIRMPPIRKYKYIPKEQDIKKPLI